MIAEDAEPDDEYVANLRDHLVWSGAAVEPYVGNEPLAETFVTLTDKEADAIIEHLDAWSVSRSLFSV